MKWLLLTLDGKDGGKRNCKLVSLGHISWRGMSGVTAGEGDGVGTSVIGDRHLLGTSIKILGGWSRLLPKDIAAFFWALRGSRTET